ncbi:hypothetical protein NQ498_01835 [Collinsella stercoris]|nr:hypothetical protein [Collinsella stercoris]UEA45474.1 hypothetical protein LK434_10195 [Collinsella stercoris DSM 13279]UWP12002.1 hypothetical protein NQ498_01835 [Collinsella stercoris]
MDEQKSEQQGAEAVEVDPGMSVVPEAGLVDVPTIIPELDSALAAVPSKLPAYVTTTWKNKPSTATPVTAEVMTRVEQRLVDLTNAVNALRDSVGQPVSVDVGDVLIGDQGYFQLFTVPAFMTAIGGSVENIIRIDLETYSSVTPVSPFSILNYWVIGQANTTVSGLRLMVWVKP